MTAYATNFTDPVEKLFPKYRARNSIEACNKILHQVFAIGNLRTRDFNAELAFISFIMIALNVAFFLCQNLFKNTRYERLSVGTLLNNFEQTYILIYETKVKVYNYPKKLVDNLSKFILHSGLFP